MNAASENNNRIARNGSLPAGRQSAVEFSPDNLETGMR
jgi:hypothetical protein